MIQIAENLTPALTSSDRCFSFQKPWGALYTLHQSQIDTDALVLMDRYSRYKYGDPDEISVFSCELEAIMENILKGSGEYSPDQWVLFTPPYSTVEPAVHPVGENLATALSIPHIDFRTSPDGDRSSQYANIKDVQSRLQAKFSTQAYIPDPEQIRGKQALVIDDMITTGTTMVYIDHLLRKDFGVRTVLGFSLVDLVAKTPSFEEYINRFLINSGNIDKLVDILNNLRFPINRHVLKSLYGPDNSVLNTIKDKLEPSFLIKLDAAAMKYYKMDD